MNDTRETLNLDEDASSMRINAHLATLETSRYLAAFSERAHRDELAVFDQTFSKTIQNMSLCCQIPAPENVLQAEKEEQEEEEEGQENRQLMCRLEEFYDDTTTDDIQADPKEGCITAQYVNNRVVIRGPYGDPFKGGFEILRTRHLLYMNSVTNLNTVEGFSKAANRPKFMEISPLCCQIMWGPESQR